MTPEFIYKTIYDMGMKLDLGIVKSERYADEAAKQWRQGAYLGRATDMIMTKRDMMGKEAGMKLPRPRKRRHKTKEAPLL